MCSGVGSAKRNFRVSWLTICTQKKHETEKEKEKKKLYCKKPMSMQSKKRWYLNAPAAFANTIFSSGTTLFTQILLFVQVLYNYIQPGYLFVQQSQGILDGGVR